MVGLEFANLVQVRTLCKDFEANIVLQVLVRWAADAQVESGVFLGHLEVPLAENVPLALLKRHKVARVLLAHVVHLRDKVVLLRDDRDLAHRGTDPESVALRCHHVRLQPDRVEVRL